MATLTLQQQVARSFTPSGDRTIRLSHLDPRPLYPEPVQLRSPWTSPTFYLAYAVVMPVALCVRSLRRMRGIA